jgi:hypothetical protein
MHNFLVILCIISDGFINLSLAITGIVLWKHMPWNWRVLSGYFILLPLFVCGKYLMWPLFHIGNRFIDNLMINPTKMAGVLLFFVLSTKKKHLKSYLMTLLLLFFTAYFIYIFFFINLLNEFPENFQLLYSFLVISLSFLGIKKLLQHAELFKIDKNPQFWFYTALLINYMPTTIIEYTRNIWSYTPESVNETVYCVYYVIYIIHTVFLFIAYFHIYKRTNILASKKI